MTHYLITDMTSREAAEAINTRKVVIIPVGAVHKHGDGPLGTDMFSCRELAKRIGEKIPEKVIVVPTLAYGVNSSAGLPGEIDISFEPVRQMIKDICMSFVRHGIKHFLFISGHGGNNAAAFLDVAKELNTQGVLCALIRWWDLIIQLKGDDPIYRNVNVLEQSVAAACGKNDPSVQRDGELRYDVFQDLLIKDVLGDKFKLPDKMKGTLICSGSTPRITSIRDGYVYEGGTIQMPLPPAPVDKENPEPGEWPIISDRVSPELGNKILDTCRDWLIKFLGDFEQLEIPDKYLT